ncbi:molybdate ABC transporter substrate-binding protein [Cryobacterium fucosi]|uniref:Molybdate ABC transporter substrate-binding protein n=1 Tax=Cryobacterium fucosi TaxID=1259157 RepID=A0A4R9B136_9MICO|nr:molybdate ABC transporter substrate-binding protein [Cryobacterium fucosi]
MLLAAAGLTAGCAGQGGSPGAPSAAQSAAASSSASPAASETLTVFAAASLTGTFTALADRFEAAHPGVRVTLNFAGSADLVTQITEGAPADVFAAADTRSMDRLAAAGLVAGKPVVFATNTLEIAVPPGNPAGIATFADLARPGVAVVACAPQVPCGAAAAKIEAATGITLAPVSEENAVTDVLGKVSTGEADAGLVYITDVTAAGGAVRGIPFPESDRAVNRYPIAVVAGSAQAKLGASFARFVTDPGGRKILSAAGFGTP